MILQNSYCITGLDMKTAGRILGVPVSDKGVLEQSWPDCLEEVVEPKLKLLIMVCGICVCVQVTVHIFLG